MSDQVLSCRGERSSRAGAGRLEAAALFLVALMAALPLLAAADPIAGRAQRGLALELLCPALLGPLLLTTRPRELRRGAARFLTSGVNLPVLLLLAWGALSWRLSSEPSLSRAEWTRLACGALLYFVIAYRLHVRRRLRQTADLTAALAIALTLAGLLYRSAGQAVDLGGPFGDRQLFGAVLMLLTPVLLAVAVGAGDPGRRLLAQIAVVLTVACLLLTRCRSAWTGAVAALLVLSVLAAAYALRDTPWRRWKHEAVWLPAALLGALLLFVSLSGAAGMIARRTETFRRLATDVSVVDRQRLWEGALRMVAVRPWLGWGIGAYAVHQTAFTRGAYRPELVRLRGPSLSDLAHNEYLQIAAETGVIGLGLHLAIAVAFFCCGLGALPRMENGLRKYLLMGCLAAVAGKWIDGLANPAWRFGEVGLFYWLILGLGCAAARIGGASEPAPAPARPPTGSTGTRAGRPGRLAWQSAVCLLIALSMGTSFASFQTEGASSDPALIARYTEIEECRIEPEETQDVGYGQCAHYRLYVKFVGVDQPFDVTEFNTFYSVDRGTDPEECIEHPGDGSTDSSLLSRFCVRPDAPASCRDRHVRLRVLFSSGAHSCEGEGHVRITGLPVNHALRFNATGDGLLGRRLYPPDDLLKTIHIVPWVYDSRFPNLKVRLVSVQSDSGGSGEQPESEILDAVSDEASPEIIVRLRASVNPNTRRRVYTLRLEAEAPNGATGEGILEFDVSVNRPRVGGFFR